MTSKTVILVAFQEQPNLGVGYLSSVLLNAGFHVKCLDFRLGREHILREVKRSDPLVVGFSVIFQYHIEKFRELIRYLRKNDIWCHFCAGGHNPSLRPAELLEFVPELNSIVRFEGEITFLELVEALFSGRDWRGIQGIAYRDSGTVIINPLRNLERDLDRFPPPLRSPLKEFALGKKYATLLAGRGCVYNCSFCSVRQFYSAPPGPVKRLRRPEMVVREMELLHDEMGCSIFMFQDDDFPVAKPDGPEWTLQFCRLLSEKGLAEKILWKMNCRPDEVSPSIFQQMNECGLFLVYLGIESGTNEGLRLMNKHMNVRGILQGVETLKELGVRYDYGYMLFDPSTTCESIRHHLDFLEQIIGDGSSPIGFGKMRPYAETQIEAQLQEEGRLIGRKGFEDYNFLDEAVNELYPIIVDSFVNWIGSHDGVMNLAKWARYYLSVYKRYFGNGQQVGALEARVKAVIAESNSFALHMIRQTCDLLEAGASSYELAPQIREKTRIAHRRYQMELKELIRAVELERNNA